MVDLLEDEPHICFECDSEFVIHTPFDANQPVSFCPFCGSELEDVDEEFDDEDQGRLFEDEE